MPGTLSTPAGVRKAGIAWKPAHRRAGCWFCPGPGWEPWQALNLPPRGWSSAWKALGGEGSPGKPSGMLPTRLHQAEDLASRRKALMPAKVFRPIPDVGKTSSL